VLVLKSTLSVQNALPARPRCRSVPPICRCEHFANSSSRGVLLARGQSQQAVNTASPDHKKNCRGRKGLNQYQGLVVARFETTVKMATSIRGLGGQLGVVVTSHSRIDALVYVPLSRNCFFSLLTLITCFAVNHLSKALPPSVAGLMAQEYP
jgi:hypothetical protein